MKNFIRTTAALGAVAALVPFGTLPAQAAATAEKAVTVEMPGTATSIDWAIDALVANKTRELKLSAIDARTAREQLQLQFRSLPAARQQEISKEASRLSGAGDFERLQMIMAQAMRVDALRVAAEAQAKSTSKAEGMKVEDILPLGPSSSDLVYVPTTGPCRVYDSRNGPGLFAPAQSRQVWVWSIDPSYSWATSQGGTGTSSTGNCVGSEFIGTPAPVSVVATVTIVNTNTTGALRAWNGGTSLTTGAIHSWNPGQTASNTTVIPIDRTIAPYPGSGSKRDIGVNNNSGGVVDVIIDVVGYFVHNYAVALDCVTVFDSANNINNATSAVFNTPACTAGYASVTAQPWAFDLGVSVQRVASTSCRFGNQSGGAATVYCDVRCCRVPGN